MERSSINRARDVREQSWAGDARGVLRLGGRRPDAINTILHPLIIAAGHFYIYIPECCSLFNPRAPADI